jgi:3-oxoacyl-[acyl-carrier protein] reductase
MDLDLKGRRALVTGSSSGIGAGIARLLAEEGCRVVVHGRDRERAEAVAEAIGAVGVALGDLADPVQAQGVGEAAKAALDGGLDILVNNAGGAAGTSAMGWTDVGDDGWVETYQGNVLAAARMIRLFVPGMKAQGFGRVIQIASAAASQPIAYGPDYGAAKAAMINMTVSLAKSLGPCGVTANCVSPGVVLTPAVQRWSEALAKAQGWGELSEAALEEKMTRTVVHVPVGRMGRPEDIGLAVCMLASPRSGYITGANIRVDGGQVQAVN